MSNIRQQIVDAIVARLKGISVAGGYGMDINGKVYDWKVTPLAPGALPAIEVRDTDAPMDVTDLSGSIKHALTVQLVLLESGKTAPAKVRSGLADIAAILHTDRTFGGLVQGYFPQSSAIDVQQDEDIMAAGQYNIILTYYTGPGEI